MLFKGQNLLLLKCIPMICQLFQLSMFIPDKFVSWHIAYSQLLNPNDQMTGSFAYDWPYGIFFVVPSGGCVNATFLFTSQTKRFNRRQSSFLKYPKGADCWIQVGVEPVQFRTYYSHCWFSLHSPVLTSVVTPTEQQTVAKNPVPLSSWSTRCSLTVMVLVVVSVAGMDVPQ